MSEVMIFMYEEKPEWVYIEGSLPKIWYGENVHLLYSNQIYATFEVLGATLVQFFGKFPPFLSWEFNRIDVSYAFKFETDEQATKVINWFESMEYLRKRKYPYPGETVMFRAGNTSVKAYRKDIEFVKHDYKRLINNGFEAVAETIKELSQYIVRFEITLRNKQMIKYFQQKDQVAYDKTPEAEEHPQKIKLKLISPKRLLDIDFYFDMLNQHKSNLQSPISKEPQQDEENIKKLLALFKATKAVRLFTYDKVYSHSNSDTKKLIKKYAPSGLLSENRRDLQKAQIHLATVDNTAPFDFTFPSSLVVNSEPDASAVAEELAKRLKLIQDNVGEVKEERTEGRSILDDDLQLEL